MQSLFPTLKYGDAHARHAVYENDDGGVAHAELRFGEDYGSGEFTAYRPSSETGG
jgi:hypothetical protein